MRPFIPLILTLPLFAACVADPEGSLVMDAPTGPGNVANVTEGLTASGFPSVADFTERGPYDTTLDKPSWCRVYRPATLGQNGVRHPVIIWGNGTFGFPAVYTVLEHWASHGFIVAAATTAFAGTGEEMLRCLDWLTAENGRLGSPYFGQVDLEHVGASGHSQGGGGAIMVGVDERIDVTAPLLPYIQGLGHDTDLDSEQNGPMLLLTAGKDVIAPSRTNQEPVFEVTNVPTFWADLKDANHFTGLGNVGGFRGPMTAWFRYHLMGDTSARSLFYPLFCGLCSDSAWEIHRKAIP